MVAELVEPVVELVVEGHQVDFVIKFGLMVETVQDVPDDQVDSEKDHSIDLVIDKLSPQDQKMILVEPEVDSRDQRVVHVGPRVVLVKVVLVDYVVVPMDQK